MNAVPLLCLCYQKILIAQKRLPHGIRLRERTETSPAQLPVRLIGDTRR